MGKVNLGELLQIQLVLQLVDSLYCCSFIIYIPQCAETMVITCGNLIGIFWNFSEINKQTIE